MKSIRKVGSIIAGTAVLGAALSAPVMAAMDNTGVTKGFFYDANFNPIVQIVVGEKGMATDAVAAGNIAATVGNLAYMTKTVSAGPGSYVPEGQVIITTAARGAVGDYVQDTNPGNKSNDGDFWDADEGFAFSEDEIKEYEKGDFSTYTLSCDKQSTTEAGLLMDGSYKNIHCLFCKTLCIESLENPAHDMEETITIDSSKIKYFEEGVGDDDSEALKMSIEKDAVAYKVKTGYIPMEDIDSTDEDAENGELDFEYRGKMILFGEEYYVKDIDGEKMYLAKAKVLDDVTSEGYAAEYNGYKFKVDHLIYAEEFKVAGILLDVQKPDGTIVQTQISKRANGVVDDLELAGIYAEEAAALQTASIIVYDLTSQVILENGEDLEMGGKTYEDWEVEFATVENCDVDPTATDGTDNDCDISEYDDMEDADLLKSVTITYSETLDGNQALEEDESLDFPNKFKLSFKGYLDNDYAKVPCTGAGEGNIMVEKGDDAYQMVVSLTADDDNRYNDVRLDEGPFSKNELFMAAGQIWAYTEAEEDDNEAGDTDDTVTVTFDPQIRGSKVDVEMIRYCDPEDEDGTGTFTGMTCDLINDTTLVAKALTDGRTDNAVVDGLIDELENDEKIVLDSYDLFIKENVATFNGFDVLYTGGNEVLFSEDAGFVAEVDDNTPATFEDSDVKVNGALVGTFDDFDTDGYATSMEVITETVDLNGDTDEDDALVVFETDDGDVVIDMTDWDYDEEADTDFSTGISLWSPALPEVVGGTPVQELDEDTDTLLIVPIGGDMFTADWGSDDRLDAVDVCHPKDDVDSTYFIGTSEEETVANSTITKADEGKDITAGCCTFTVASFDVTVSGGAAADVTTQTANKIVGAMVVPETSADTSKNLVIVGGPSVNAMTTVTKDDISAAADKYIVKKDGNKLIVAGWESEDTVAAGNALIAWLNANVHA